LAKVGLLYARLGVRRFIMPTMNPHRLSDHIAEFPSLRQP
jgi:hypothetical protein